MLKMLNKKVLLAERKSEKVSDSGIILSRSLDTPAAVVVSCGPDVDSVSKGDVVYCELSRGKVVSYENMQYVVVDESDISVVLEK